MLVLDSRKEKSSFFNVLVVNKEENEEVEKEM
jgi:hypothetical protein